MGPERIRVLKTLRPGAPGAKRLQDEFGESLACVRCRYDPAAEARLTTVELILKRARPRQCSVDPEPPVLEPMVEVKVHYRETELRAPVKQDGGRWRPDAGVWELPLGAVRRLGIIKRIARPPARTGARGYI